MDKQRTSEDIQYGVEIEKDWGRLTIRKRLYVCVHVVSSGFDKFSARLKKVPLWIARKRK